MHNNLPNIFTFINSFEKDYIRKLDKKIGIIFRDYSKKIDKNLIQEINIFCQKNNRKFFLSNNVKLATNLNLDGVYIPAFNKKMNIIMKSSKRRFVIIGSAHNVREIKKKEKQGVEVIFLSPLFKTSKSSKFLNPIKFNILASKTKKKVIALGGINSKNINKLKIIKSYGFAGISCFKNDVKINIINNEYR